MRIRRWRCGVVAGVLAVAATLTASPAAPSHAATDCDVSYSVLGQWPGGFLGALTITNKGEALSTWSLTFTFPAGQTVTSGWSGKWSSSGSQVTVANESWNGRLATGASASPGFLASWAGSNPPPTAFLLNGVACNGPVATTTQPDTTTAQPETTTTTTDPDTTSTTTDPDTTSTTTDPETTTTQPETTTTAPETTTTAGTPYCVDATSDPDGDGWGWENSASCIVPGSVADPAGPTVTTSTASNGTPYCIAASSDPDGDGWGWEFSRSCIVVGSAADPAGPTATVTTSGQGTTGATTTTTPSTPVSTAPNGVPYCYFGVLSDPDGDGWGWENQASCIVPGSTADPAGTTTSTTTTGTPQPTYYPDPDGDPTTCGEEPVDPLATAQAKKVLCYLYSQYGNHIISGQQESTWISGPEYEMEYLFTNTGKYPAIRGLDMGDSPDFGARALTWWNKGGIPMVGYHMGSPAQTVDGYTGSQKPGDITAALTAGTADNARLLQRLDAAAAQLKIVQDGGGAVIWRPYHEAGGTWFWWSMEGGAKYVQLWRYTYEYLTETKGLHNLVWLLPYNGQPDPAFDPGRAYYDVGGADVYAPDHGAQKVLFDWTKNLFGGSIPIALHENGPIPDPDLLQAAGSRWVLFNTWHTEWLTATSRNPIDVLQRVYTSDYVVTLDELPDLR